MRRFLRAELATVFRKPKLYVLLLVTLFGFGLGVLIDFFVIKSGSTAGQILIEMFYAICAIILVADITHKEYKFGTMKNLVGCGFTRTNIFVGKYITTMIVSLIFIMFEKIVKWAYCTFKGDVVFLVADIMDIIRQFFMFSLIFVICMLIVSDSISLVMSMLYGVILPMAIPLIAPFIFGKNSMAGPRITAILMVSDSAYMEDVVLTASFTITDKVIVPKGMIWFYIGIAFVIAALIVGCQVFKRKDVK